MIPFQTDFEPNYGQAIGVSPLIRRVVAENPGPFTYTGTGAHIVGHGRVAVIDPGPDDPRQLEAILAATWGETVSHIFVTHSHMDHSPLARPLAEATGAAIYAGGEACKASDGGARLEAGDDLRFRPDVPLVDRQRFYGPNWSIEAVATPGHTSNHFAYALIEENALFPGDCVMGWSTSVISPPDGDMGDYLASLEKIRARRFRTLLPAHGPPIRTPAPFLAAYIDHRRRREAEILDALEVLGPTSIRRMVALIYAEVDRRLHPAACHTVLAHLIHLMREGLVECSTLPTLGAVYRPARLRKAA